MFPMETSSVTPENSRVLMVKLVTPENSRVLMVKLGCETSVVAYSSDRHSKSN